MIEITLTGIPEIRDRLSTLLPEVQDKILRGGTQAAFNTAQDAADRHTRSGNGQHSGTSGALARSLQMRPITGGYEVYHDLQMAPHAKYVHWGTKPHDIKPKDRKALRFVWKGGVFHFWFGPQETKWAKANIYRWMKEHAPGGVAHFSWPHHPGYKGDPWMIRARDEAKATMIQIFQSIKL